MTQELIFGINTGATVLGILVTLVMIFSLLSHDDMKQKDNWLFFCLCVCIVFTLVTDSVVEFYRFYPMDMVLFKSLMVISYIMVNAYVVLFTFYMALTLKKKAYINTSAGYVMVFLVGLTSILWTVDVIYEMGWFVDILPGVGYEETDAYLVIAAVPVLIVVFDAFLAWSFRDVLKTSEVLPWVTYALLPCIAIPFAIWLGITTIYVSEVIALLIVFVFEHSQRQKVAAQTEKELANSKMKLMLSQIQPHFMYNSLNSIYYLIEADPEQAQEAVSSFSDYLRQNINSLKSDSLVLFEEELNHTEAYLYLERLRFGEKLKIEYDIKAKDFKVPPLTLQPLVENAVKHGLGPRGGEGTITIKSYEDDKNYYVEVKDDGVGFAARSFNDKDNTHTHIGIFNVNSRLVSLCSGGLSVSSSPGEGTTSVIKVPKKNQREEAEK